MKFFLAFLLLFSTAQAREFKGVTMPDTMKVGEKELTLNGMGIRKVLIVKDVYVAGLYVESSMQPPVKDGEKILNSDSIKHITLEFKMYVPGSSIKDAWDDGTKKNCKKDCNFTEALNTFKSWMHNFKKGEKIEVTFFKDKIDVSVSGENKGSIVGAEFSRLLLSIFIGVPPEEDLKAGLLGLK